MQNWTQHCYSRLLVDNHITDLHPDYMTKYDPAEYARLVELSGVESAMVYSCDHNGNCYYPTKIGHQHANLRGRDLLRENITLLREKGITPVAYYTLIYHNDAARRLPDAVVRDNLGHTHDRRYHYVCPNQPEAVAFFKAQLSEILQYDIDGIFLDMTFWPAVCCCSACRAKYGRDFPKVIDWDSPEWVGFQRFREASIAEFAADITAHVRSIRPGCTVTHQFSPVLHGWLFGQSDGVSAASDYASGDFYGEKLQQRFGTKAFAAHTRGNIPFEFMTSRCVSLYDHTSTKSEDEMRMSAITTLANGGVYFFIDAINPVGTFQENFYRTLGRINRDIAPFRNCIAENHARLSAETGLYFSMACCVDRSLNGVRLQDYDGGRANNMAARGNAMFDEVLGTAEILTQMHVPFRVLAASTQDYSSLKAIVINDSAYLSDAECERLRAFVKNGGTLIATGRTGLYDEQARGNGDFRLADVFGVHFTGRYSGNVCFTGEECILADGEAPLATPEKDTEILGWLTMTDFSANDPEKYAAIHSNPPSEKHSGHPAITCHAFGKGRCLWIAAPFLRLRQYTQQTYAKRLFREYLPAFVTSSVNLPESTEITLLKGDRGNSWILTLVNQQNQFPAIPLHDVSLTVRLPFLLRKAIRTADGTPMAFTQDGDQTTFHFPLIREAEFLQLTSS